MSKGPGKVARTLALHEDTLNRVVNTGMLHELAYFPVTELPEPITFQRTKRTFTHIKPASYAIGGDYPRHFRGNWVGIYPQLSVRLQEGAAAAEGVVSWLRYREFALSDKRFKEDAPDITPHLIPETFSVERGDHFGDNFVYGGHEITIGSEADQGDLALFTARALTATAHILGEYDQAQLDQMAHYSN